MTLKNLFTCICFLLAGITAAQAKSVTLTEAGTLTTFISDEELNTLTELTVSGPINGSDIKIIRAMGGTLKTLDLGNAQIVAGGDAYYLTEYYTQNDIIGDRMFYAMTALEKIVMPKDVWCIGTWSRNTPYDESTGKYNGNLNNYSSDVSNTSAFGNGSFYQCVNLKEIVFPEKLVYIGNKVFGNCVKLTSITIPEGVEMLGAACFTGCSALESVSLPSTLGVNTKFSNDWTAQLGFKSFTEAASSSYPGSYIFYNCSKLTTVALPTTMKNLGIGMFAYCTALETIQLPAALERVNGAFEGCSSLTSITFPETVTQIGNMQGCSSLTSLEIPANATIDDLYCTKCTSLENITFKGSVGTTISHQAFRECTSLKAIAIPGSVTTIESYAFYECSSLADVTFPENLASIGENAFTRSGIKKVSLARNVSSIGGATFYECENLESFTFSPNITTIESKTFYGCKSLKDVTLPNSLAFIRSNAFYGCSSLGKISIPGGVQTIETGAFQNAGLTEVELKEGVISLKENSFSGCQLLKTVSFPTTIKSIKGFNNTGVKNINFAEGAAPEEFADFAFAHCDSLGTLTIPSSVKYVGRGAFYSCDTLQSITLPAAIDSIHEGTFAYCHSLDEITIPEGVKSIGTGAFSHCLNLKKATLPASVSNIGTTAFFKTALTDVTIPEGVSTLNYGTFSDCNNLVSVKLPSTLTSIEYNGYNIYTTGLQDYYSDYRGDYYNQEYSGVFASCNKLKTIDFNGAAVTHIAGRTFWDCTELESLDLSSTKIEDVPSYMLGGCTKLRSFTFPATVKTIQAYALDRCSGLENVVFPAALTGIDNKAFENCNNIKSVDFSATSLTTISQWFSWNCPIETVKLPETVTTIGESAFYGHPITSINFPSKLTSIGANAFTDNRIANLTFPASLTTIGETAFARGRYKTVEIPATITSVGAYAFRSSEISDKLIITPNDNLSIGDIAFDCYGRDEWYDENGNWQARYFHLNNVYWNSTKTFPKDEFCNIDYLFLPTGGNTSSTNNIAHIFYDGVTPRIDIAYSENNYVYSFSVANEMKANRLNYRQQFSSTSGYSEAAGWKTIVLPYDVTEITYERSSYNENDTIALAPFGSEALNTAGTLPFWLYELGTDGEYKAATAIKAHTPYLICMPNNDKYPSEYNINGYVNFSAVDNTNGVALKPTAGALKRSIGTKFDLVPTYDGVMMHDSVYVLNEKNSYSGDDKTYPPGSVFIKNYKEGYYSNLPAVYPFQAYLVTKETNVTTASTRGPLYYSIGGGNGEITGIEDTILMPDQAVKVYARGGVLYIESNAARTIHIYNVSGRTVRTIEVQEGQNEVRGLGNGIYLLEGQKVIVK